MNRPAPRDSDTGPDPVSPGGSRPERYPWQLGLAGVAWLTLGGLLVFVGVGGNDSSAASDEASLDQLGGLLGGSVGGVSSGNIALVFLGFVVLVLAGMLFLGQGWSRYLLAGLGALTVLVLALSGRWESFLAMVLLVLGSVPLLAPSPHRYLNH